MTPTDDLSPESRKQLASELSGKLAEALTEPITTPMSLYHIEAEMAELGELYQEALADGAEADALAIQGQLQRYVAAEVQKVDNCAGFIRYAKDMGERIAAEEDRLAKARRAWERITDGVKAMVLGVMQQTQQRKLQGKFSRFRIQKNSQDAVVIDDPAKVPPEFLRVTVTTNLEAWLNFQEMFPLDAKIMTQLGTPEISLSRVKQAIDGGREVPGARLVRNEHLRVE